MSVNCETTTARKNKWLPKGLLIIAVLMTIYLILFAIRFVQLNYCGKHRLFTTQIPETLYNGYIDSSNWEGHFLPEDWAKLQVPMQFIDFNWDGKTDFVLHTRDMIMVVEPAKNGKWNTIAFADNVNSFLYLPFAIWGNPVVLRLKKCNPQDGYFVTME